MNGRKEGFRACVREGKKGERERERKFRDTIVIVEMSTN